jgi:hypothetical protein
MTKLAKEIFGVNSVTRLSEEEKTAVYRAQEQSHTWRLNQNSKRVFAIGKGSSCAQDVYAMTIEEIQPCTACLELLKNPRFQTAIQKPKPIDENRIYTPHQYQASEIGKQFAALRGLSKLIEEVCNFRTCGCCLYLRETVRRQAGNGTMASLLQRTVKAFTAGQFDDKPIITGLLEVVIIKADKESRGVGLQGIKYPPGFDDWAHELSCINPEAYRSFKTVFGGRTERSFQEIRAKRPAFHEGFEPAQLLQRAKHYLEDFGYPAQGPLSIAVDDTKLHGALLPCFNNDEKKWYLVGSTRGAKAVTDLDSVQEIMDQEKEYKATKLRLWTLSIPLPAIPPLILAAKAIPSKISSSELAAFEESILNVLLPAGFRIMALGSDGTSVERDSRRALV